jgi:chemotaxis protein CheX
MQENVTDIVRNIWQSVLGLDVEANEGATGDPRHPDALMACIQISGAWSGIVAASVSEALSRKLAAAMLAMELNETSPDDARDCLGELVNMIGGNLKAVLPAPCALSLPWVTTGAEYSVSFPHCSLHSQLPFRSEGEPMHITIFKADAAPPAAKDGAGTASAS